MTITFEVSKEVEEQLHARWGDLSAAAKEALAIESYRARRVSVGFVAKMLGMGVLEAEDWLRRRNVVLNYTENDLNADEQTLSRILGGA